MVDKEEAIQSTLVFTGFLFVIGVIWFLLSISKKLLGIVRKHNSKKLLGIVLALIGIWLIVKFPDAEDIQYKAFTKAGIALGIFLIIIGAILIIL